MRPFATVVVMLAGLSLSAVAFSATTHAAKPVTKSASTHTAKARHHTRHHHTALTKHHVAKKTVSKK